MNSVYQEFEVLTNSDTNSEVSSKLKELQSILLKHMESSKTIDHSAFLAELFGQAQPTQEHKNQTSNQTPPKKDSSVEHKPHGPLDHAFKILADSMPLAKGYGKAYNTVDKEQRRSLLSNSLFTKTGPQTYVYTDSTYLMECQVIEYDEYDVDTDDPVSLFVKARDRNGSFVFVMDLDTRTINVVVPNQIGPLVRSLNGGLTASEIALIKIMIEHFHLLKLKMLVNMPRGAPYSDMDKIGPSLQTFKNHVLDTFADHFRVDCDFVWYDTIDRYFTDMKNLETMVTTQPCQRDDANRGVMETIERVENAIGMLIDPDYLGMSHFFNEALKESREFLMNQRQKKDLVPDKDMIQAKVHEIETLIRKTCIDYADYCLQNRQM